MKIRVFIVILLAFAAIVIQAADPVWKKDLTKETIPETPAKGKANGADFNVDKATFQGGILNLKQGKSFFADKEFIIFTFLKKDDKIAGKKFAIKPDTPGMVPHVHFTFKVKGKDFPDSKVYMRKYSMLLEFGTPKDKKLPGKIYLCLPDKEKSFVAGTFEADIK